jgi:hypothetical protein
MKMSMPSFLLRIEGVALLAGAITIYAHEEASWLLFALAFFAPDLSMLGFTGGSRLGAGVYNAAHATVIPLALVVAGLVAGHETALTIGLVWLAHIGFDRVLGYGLKYPEGFKETHLARV